MEPTLVIVRHAQAGPEAGSQNVLTPAGVREARRTAALLADRGIRPARILHSPKKRARETAEILADGLGLPRALLSEHPELGPDAEGEGILRDRETRDEGPWILVSHLPTLQAIAHQALAGGAESLHFPPACALVLGRETGGPWKTIWIHPGPPK